MIKVSESVHSILSGSAHIYRPRSRGDNTFGSVHLFVHLCVCALLLSSLLFLLARSGRLGGAQDDFACSLSNLFDGVQYSVVNLSVSTGWALAVDHILNCAINAIYMQDACLSSQTGPGIP